jgi:hypothetical protein
MLVAGRVFNTHTIERRTVLTANTKATNFKKLFFEFWFNEMSLLRCFGRKTSPIGSK